jgi:ceramide glucosyltransferase
MILIFSAWRTGLLVLALAPAVYYVLVIIAARRFVGRKQRWTAGESTPPVSVLKPVRGVDFGSYENFASFCRQDYPDYQILFGLNDENDPALPVIRKVIEEFPGRRIRVLIGAEDLGANRKVNIVSKLAREAEHRVIVLTDGDVRVGRNFLKAVVAPLSDRKTGAVTCFYRAIAERNLWAETEAIGTTSDFFGGVLMAEWKEGIRFALGAAIATTKEWLEKIGGFESLAGILADDYELGNRIAKAGGEVVLSREAVWTMYPAQTFASFWQHQLRWARTVRLCRPLSYLGLLFTQGLPLTLLAIFLARSKWMAVGLLGAYLSLRLTMAWQVGVRGIGDQVLKRNLWLVPLRDALYFFVWMASFASNRVRWGAGEYVIRGGRMVPLEQRK